MMSHLIRWTAVVGMLACAATCQAQDRELASEHAHYQNSVMTANLNGRGGTVTYRCTKCNQWHKGNLTHERTIRLSQSGYRGSVYKVRGMDKWYFFGDDEAVESSSEHPRYPVYVSTTSSNAGFKRIRTEGGTRRGLLLSVSEVVVDAETGAALPGGEGDPEKPE